MLTIVNSGVSSHLVTVSLLGEAGASLALEQVEVGAGVATTTSLVAELSPARYRVSCVGCRSVIFGVAVGQGVLVSLLDSADTSPVRGELLIANEGDAPLSGALRTGEAAGAGRTVVRFELAVGEARRVGIRAGPEELVSLHVDCDACPDHALLIGNGVEIEVPLAN